VGDARIVEWLALRGSLAARELTWSDPFTFGALIPMESQFATIGIPGVPTPASPVLVGDLPNVIASGRADAPEDADRSEETHGASASLKGNVADGSPPVIRVSTVLLHTRRYSYSFDSSCKREHVPMCHSSVEFWGAQANWELA